MPTLSYRLEWRRVVRLAKVENRRALVDENGRLKSVKSEQELTAIHAVAYPVTTRL